MRAMREAGLACVGSFCEAKWGRGRGSWGGAMVSRLDWKLMEEAGCLDKRRME